MVGSEMKMSGFMKGRMMACRWCAFFPVTFGVIFFLLGYFLDAEVIRVLWMIFSGFMILMGTIMFIMMIGFFRQNL